MITEESMDNSFWHIDILGSWIEVGMVLAVILTGVIVAVPTIRQHWNKKKIVWPCDKSYRIMHSRIHEFLTEVRIRSHASRTAVLQFHNGGNFLDGSSIKRFSVTHESCQVGVSETTESRQNLQASPFIELLNILMDEERTGTLVSTADLPDCHLKRHMEANHTLVFSVFPLKDARGALTTGFLLCEWCEWDHIEDVDEEILSCVMRSHSRFIEGQIINGAKYHA